MKTVSREYSTSGLMRDRAADTRARGSLVKTSLMGALGCSPWAWMALKTGVSSSLSRISRPKPTSTAEARKATRQPQERKSSLLSVAASTARTPLAIRLPAGGPICAAEDQKPRLLGVAEFAREQDGTAPLAADADALRQAQQHEDDGCGYADGGVARQRADHHRRDADQQQGGHEDVLAADLVTEPAEDHAADGTGEVAHRKGREGQQQPDVFVVAREEDLGEHQGRGHGVDREVVVLQRSAGEARDVGLEGTGRDLPLAGGRGGLMRCCSHGFPPGVRGAACCSGGCAWMRRRRVTRRR